MKNQLIVMIGASGSGKTTIAKAIVSTNVQAHLSARAFSADDFFLSANGEYHFDLAKLGEAHGECLRGVVHALQDDVQVVVVDNTNTSEAEIAPYIALGLAYVYDVVPVVVRAPAGSEMRGVHGVSEAGVKGQLARIEKLLAGWPPFWPTVVHWPADKVEASVTNEVSP